MGLIDRITGVIRANITSLISRAEDPEKVLEQTVAQMQDNLIQLRQAVAGAIATQKKNRAAVPSSRVYGSGVVQSRPASTAKR